MRKTKAEKQLDKAIESVYYVLASGRQINIMDIPKLFADARRDILTGETVNNAVGKAIDKFCLKNN